MGRDPVVEGQGLRDGVEPLNQPLALVVGDLDGERGLRAVRRVDGDLQRDEVDGGVGPAGAPCCINERLPVLRREFQGQEAVVVGVALEDVGEALALAGCDDRAKARLGDGPDGVLAARPAAEVLADHEDRRALGLGGVERELGGGGAVLLGGVDRRGAVGDVSLVGEEQGTVADPLDPLEVAGRDDQVGVDVGPVEDGQLAAVGRERFHGSSLRRQELPDVDEPARDGRGRRHRRADQVGPAAGPLSPLEIAVAGAGRTLAGGEPVGVHRQAHAATGLSPLGARGFEHLVQPLGLGLGADLFAARDDQGPDTRCDLPALQDIRRAPQVLDPAVGARPDEDDVDGDLADRGAGGQAHVFQGPLGVILAGERHLVGLGDPAGDVDCHRRVRAPGDLRDEFRGVNRDPAVEGRRVVGPEGLPVRDGRLKGSTLRGEAAVVLGDVLDRDVVGGDQARAGAGLDRHVADGHPAFHGEGRDGGPVVLQDGPGAAAGADLADDREDDVLGFEARRELADDLDPERLRPLALPEGLRREDVLDLAGADAEGERPEGPVGAGVRVAADDRGAGERQAELGSDDVDDALVSALHVIERHAELRAVLAERLDLPLRERVLDVELVLGRDVVVEGGEGQVGPAHRPLGEPEAVERLRAGHFVDQVTVDVQQRGFFRGVNHVTVPHLVKQGLGHERTPWVSGRGWRLDRLGESAHCSELPRAEHDTARSTKDRMSRRACCDGQAAISPVGLGDSGSGRFAPMNLS